jgi:hypothetical protein
MPPWCAVALIVKVTGVQVDSGNALIGPMGPPGRDGNSITVPIEPWHTVGDPGEPAMENGWLNYGAPYGPVQFRKMPDGTVELRGLMSGSAINAALPSFHLPPGYCPPAGKQSLFAVQSNQAIGRVNVDNSGAVSVEVGSPSWVSVNEVRFDTGTITEWTTGPKGDTGAAGSATTVQPVWTGTAVVVSTPAGWLDPLPLAETDSYADIVLANNTIIVPKRGLYDVIAQIGLSPNGASCYGHVIAKINGVDAGPTAICGLPQPYSSLDYKAVLLLDAGDTLSFKIFTNLVTGGFSGGYTSIIVAWRSPSESSQRPLPAPTLTDVDPIYTSKGNPLTLTGTYFKVPTAGVRFLRESTSEEWWADNVVVVDGTTITCDCPDMGPNDQYPVVSVVTQGGESEALPFNYSGIPMG